MTKEIGDLQVKLGLDSAGFQNGIFQLNRQMRVIQSEFQAANAKLGYFGKSTDHLRLKASFLNQQMQIQTQKVAVLKQAYAQSAETKGKDAKATQDLTIKLNKAEVELSKLSHQYSHINQLLQQNTNLWQRLSQSIQKTADKIKTVGQRMSEVGQSLTLLSAPLIAVGGGAVKAAIDFESAFAGVRKTVEGTEREFQQWSQGIRSMAKEVPFAATEIAKVAEVAGQLGIKKESILSFTRTMLDMGVASNLSSEEAATALARLANITQMEQDKFQNLGSTISALGNTLATTEAEMVEMSLRVAGAGHQVNMTEAQIVSLAGALSSVGIHAESGGSSISRVMIEIANAVQLGGERLNLFAKVAGITGTQFQKAFQQDAAGAIVSFIEGLGKMKESGQNVFAVLKELGLNEIQVRDSLLRASGAGNLFRKSLETGTHAWKENLALTQEAQQRYKTTESQMKIFWNKLKDVGITLGQSLIPALIQLIDASQPLLSMIEQLAKKFAVLSPSTRAFVVTFAGIGLVAGPLLIALGAVISSLGTLGSFLAVAIGFFVKVGPVLLRFATGIVPLLTGAFYSLITVFNFLRVVMLTNPFGIILTAIGLLVVAGVAVYKNWDTVKNALSNIWKAIKHTFLSSIEAISTFVGSGWNNMKRTSLSVFHSLISGIKTAWNSTIHWFQTLPGKFMAIGKSLFISMRKGVSSTIVNIKSVITTAINQSIYWLQSLPSRMVQIGRNIISGLIQGMNSLLAQVKSTISHIAHTISNGVRSALGIRSPSHVMMEMGTHIGDGLSIGMKNSLSRIQRQAQQMAQAAVPIIPNVQNIQSRSRQSSYPSTLQPTTTNEKQFVFHFHQPIYTHNQHDIQKLADTIMQTIKRNQISHGRARGEIIYE